MPTFRLSMKLKNLNDPEFGRAVENFDGSKPELADPNDEPNFSSVKIEMFDPSFVGNVEAKDVQVEAILPGVRHIQCFQGILTLQNHRHRLLFKPNVSGKRDQIVADRLKYLFDLKPMHVFGLSLNFLYRGGERQDCAWIEYLAISLGRQVASEKSHLEDNPLSSRWETLEAIRLTPLIQELDFQIELCKIVMFRYVIGTSETRDEHILVRVDESKKALRSGQKGDSEIPQDETNGSQKVNSEISHRGIEFEIMSISETMITSLCPPRYFLDSLRFISPEAWEKAQKVILQHFDYDYERGIILQTRRPERELKMRRSLGSLTMKAKDIAASIEDRVGLVTTCDVSEILKLMRGA